MSIKGSRVMKMKHKVLYAIGIVTMLALLAGDIILFSRLDLIKDDASIINLAGTVMGGIQRVVGTELGGRNADPIIAETDKALSLLFDHARSTGNGELAAATDETKKEWTRLKEILLVHRVEAKPEIRENIVIISERLWANAAETAHIVQRDTERRMKIFYLIIPTLIAMAIILLSCFLMTRLYLRLRIRHLSTHDQTTGTLNSPAFAYILQQHLLLADRYERTSALIMFSVDQYGDLIAHHGGERAEKVLGLLAELVRQNTRRSDAAARLDKDRFAVLLPETDLPRAVKIAEKIRGEVEAFHFGPEALTITAGVTQIEQGESADMAIARVESAWRRALKSDDKKISAL